MDRTEGSGFSETRLWVQVWNSEFLGISTSSLWDNEAGESY